MQRKVFLIMGIVIVACAIWISCDNNMPEMYKIGGSSTSYYYNDTLDSYDGPNNECDTGFWAETKDRLWQETLRSACQELGCYVYQDPATGTFVTGKTQYGPELSNYIRPSNASPELNGLVGDEWITIGFIHTHNSSDCMGEGYRRGVGPSNEDQEWANATGLILYTIDYAGLLDKDRGYRYIPGGTNFLNTKAIWYESLPKRQ